MTTQYDEALADARRAHEVQWSARQRNLLQALPASHTTGTHRAEFYRDTSTGRMLYFDGTNYTEWVDPYAGQEAGQ